jgi:hypothetical protein
MDFSESVKIGQTCGETEKAISNLASHGCRSSGIIQLVSDGSDLELRIFRSIYLLRKILRTRLRDSPPPNSLFPSRRAAWVAKSSIHFGYFGQIVC